MIKDIYAAHFYIIINSFDIQIFFMVQTVFICSFSSPKFHFSTLLGFNTQLKMSTGTLHCNRHENNQENVQKVSVLPNGEMMLKFPTINLCKEIVFLYSSFSG